MRCHECNVDLGETYRVCPLCGAAACDDAPQLAGLRQADYPDVTKSTEETLIPDAPNKHVFRICAVLSVVFCFAGTPVLWPILAPVLLLGAAIYQLVCAAKEPGCLLHAGLSLFCNVLTQAGLLLCAALLGRSLWQLFLVFVFCAAAFLILCVLKPERMKAQFQATFHI